ncbi:MAG TPA: ribbon-helix-helix domain-containing protein [Burkholderiaceae bacterium]|nr:ribbon-helix-helix domain-containing protein [Burkholderiaceae bacterium]
MCKLFVNADPDLYTFQTRSIRLHGVATSLRLEKQFWDVLAEIGARDAMTVPQLIARLYDELMATGADLNNFASFLRVCCTRYLSLQRFGLIPGDPAVPIRSLDADSVLAAERAHARRCAPDAHVRG